MSDPNKIQPPKKGIEMVKGGGYPAKAVSTSVQQHTAPIQTDMYLIGSKAVQWALIGLAFYAALRLFRSVIMDALGFRKSRKEAKESEALNENGLENLDQDPMSEPLEEFEGLDGEEPPDNMPNSPEEDPGLQYDLENERWEINASTALQEGHEYGSDEFYSRIAELEEMDRLWDDVKREEKHR